MEFSTIRPIEPLWDETNVPKATGASNGDGPAIPFADVFQAAVDSVKETDAAQNEARYLLATGQIDNPAVVSIAETQAAMSVELLVQLRNRALDAYSELMRISM